jgi:hypothetical protein
MSVATDASSAYFGWRYHHPHEAEDPSAIWGAAWRAGGRAAMQDSSRLVELVPLLRDLLCLLEDGAVEAAVRASDPRFWEGVGIDPDYEAAHDAWESLAREAADDCWVSW